MVLVVLIAGFAFTAGCTGNDGQDTGAKETATVTETPTPLPTAEVTPNATETGIPESGDAAATLSGSGDYKGAVELTGGVHLFTFEQNTPENSTISISTEKDGVSVSNQYNLSTAQKSMKDGRYYWTYAFMLEEDARANVEVTTPSNWTLSFTVPQMINGIVPQTFTGTAGKATPFFQINEGEYNFSIKTENNTYISATLMDYYGMPVFKDEREEPLAFHHGTYDDVVTVKINESNNYLMNILCDGDWTVAVVKA